MIVQLSSKEQASITGSNIAALGALLQLADLELKSVAVPTTVEQLGAALTPLTRLTRLIVEFGSRGGVGGCAALDCLPEAVFSPTALRALQFGGRNFVFRQGISPALAKLRHLEQLKPAGSEVSRC